MQRVDKPRLQLASVSVVTIITVTMRDTGYVDTSAAHLSTAAQEAFRRWSQGEAGRGRVAELLAFATRDTGDSQVWATAGQKLFATLCDQQVHSGSFLTIEGDHVLATMVRTTWTSEQAESVLETVFVNALATWALHLSGGRFPESGLGGLLLVQLSIDALDEMVRVTAAGAYRAWPDNATLLPEKLKSDLCPWSTIQRAEEPKALPKVVAQAEIVALAQVTLELVSALYALWTENPDGKPPFTPRWHEARTAAARKARELNTEAERCLLPNRAPFFETDQFFSGPWIKHVLTTNAIQNSVSAEVRRAHGPELATMYDRNTTARLGLAFETFRQSNLKIGPASQPFPPVFLCYSWANKLDRVRVMFEQLKSSNVDVWFDELERPDTGSLDERIRQALLNASIVVACLSNEFYTRGGYAVKELVWVLSQLPAAAAVRRVVLIDLDGTPRPKCLEHLLLIPTGELVSFVRRFRPTSPLASEPLEDPSANAWTRNLRGLTKPQRKREGREGRESVDRLRQRLGLLRLRTSMVNADLAEDFDSSAKAYRTFLANVADSVPDNKTPAESTWLVRIHLAGLRALVSRAHSDEYETDLATAYRALESVISTPLPDATDAWSSGSVTEALIAVRDQRDAAAFAAQWFRHWSPEMLRQFVDEEHARLTATVERRLSELLTSSAEWLLRFRLLQDERVFVIGRTLDIGTLHESLARTLTEKLRHVDSNIRVSFLFSELRTILTDEQIPVVALGLGEQMLDALDGNPGALVLSLEHAGLEIQIKLRGIEGALVEHDATVSQLLMDDLHILSEKKPPVDLIIAVFTWISWVPEEDAWSTRMRIAAVPSASRAELSTLPPALHTALIPVELLTPEHLEIVKQAAATYLPVELSR